MSGPDPKHQRALAVRPSTATYEVGYGKPPADARFKPGQSGNPRGRPKGKKNRPKLPALNEERLKAIILEEAYRKVTINDAGGPVAIPMAQAVVRSLAVNAAKGHQRAQRLFTQLLASTETSNKRLHDEWLETAITYKVEWEREIKRCEQFNLPAPEPLPHPDDILIDMRTGSVRVKGPMTKEEKAQWDWMRERKLEFQKEVNELKQLLIDEPDYPHRKFVEDDIAHSQKIVDMIARVITD